MKRKYFKVIKSILTILITVWILFSLMVYFNQNNLVYVPTKGSNYTPSNYNLIYEDITLTTEDNHGLFRIITQELLYSFCMEMVVIFRVD